jgi:hypothetical protein
MCAAPLVCERQVKSRFVDRLEVLPFWPPASVAVRWTTLCLIRAFRFGHQRRGNTSEVPCFGGLYGSLWPASDGEVFSATIFGELFPPDDSGF